MTGSVALPVRRVGLIGRRRALIVLAVVTWLVASGFAPAQIPVPVLTGRVNDYGDMLPAEAEAALEPKLAQIETDTGAQVVVVTIPSLDGEAIEEFGIRAARTWKLGHKGTDNGVLLVIARDERQMRIEVGYGLEGTLTDIQSKRIISDVITPYFRQGDVAGGLNAGIDAIGGTIRGDPTAIHPVSAASDASGGSGGFIVVLIFAFVAVILPGLFGWILYLFVVPMVYGVTAGLGPGWAIAATLAWLIGCPILRRMLARIKPNWLTGTNASGGRGGLGPMWSGNASHGGWRSGGGLGGSGGGFSGGGGSFGGGGASGGW